MSNRISQLATSGTLTGTELVVISKPSATVTITASTISAAASDNSFNDSAGGFLTAGFAVGKAVQVSGFTGNAANNLFSGVITSLTAAKMAIGGIDGDVIVDDAAGEAVTITQWESRRSTAQAVAGLGGAGGGSTIGRHTVPIMAGAMRPTVANGCGSLLAVATAAAKPDIVTLGFDSVGDEFAQFALAMPKCWDEGTITAKFVWSHSITTANFGVVWGLQGVAISDDDAISVAYGTVQTVADTGGTADDLYVSPETAAITIAGAPAAEDMVVFRVSRLTADGADTLAVDARLHAVILYITTAADTDA